MKYSRSTWLYEVPNYENGILEGYRKGIQKPAEKTGFKKYRRISGITAGTVAAIAAVCGGYFLIKKHPGKVEETAVVKTSETGTTDEEPRTVSASTANIDWLPGHSVSNKIAVIINGDSEQAMMSTDWDVVDSRHTDNTDIAVSVLDSLGFDDIFVAQEALVSIPYSYSVTEQYPTSEVGTLFTDLESHLREGSLVFVYWTGHGGKPIFTDSRFTSFEPAVNLGNSEYVDKQMIAKYASNLSLNEAMSIWVFDGCTTGEFPEVVIGQTEFEGIALSPGVGDNPTCCVYFVDPFFDGLQEGVDLNDDGITQISEVFRNAMSDYSDELIQPGEKPISGTYFESNPELTLENFDEIMAGKRPVLIMVGATWCGPCHTFDKILSGVKGLIGEQVKVVRMTSDTNPDAGDIYSNLGLERIQVFPTLVAKMTDGTFEILALGAVPEGELLKLLSRKLGIKPAVVK